MWNDVARRARTPKELWEISDKKPCHERPGSAVTPRAPDSSPPLKQARLKVVRQRSDSINLGRLAFFRHLERVETMRCFWELKHIELTGDFEEVG
ncbi:hypothetical protein AOLI_G00105590 [Acnodon oligacanthus]